MNYPFKTICCIISSPCHLCNLEYDKVELRIGTKNNRNYSKRKSMIYRDLTGINFNGKGLPVKVVQNIEGSEPQAVIQRIAHEIG